MGADPACTVVVEDSPTGIRSAKAAGLYTVAFAGSVIAQDRSEADELISSYAEWSI